MKEKTKNENYWNDVVPNFMAPMNRLGHISTCFTPKVRINHFLNYFLYKDLYSRMSSSVSFELL